MGIIDKWAIPGEFFIKNLIREAIASHAEKSEF
jgi:hypothetical protein